MGDTTVHQAGTCIYFVRHGAVHNPEAVFYGRLPRFGLSDAGRRQAAGVAEYLAAVPLAAIYTSPLLRARQTAGIIQRAQPMDPPVPITVSRSLLEIRTGRQGEPVAALDADGWNFYDPPRHADDETIAAIYARIRRFCRLALQRHPGAAVAAVTHGDLVAIARAAFEGRPLELASLRGDWYPQTASVLAVTLAPDLRPRAVAYHHPAGVAG